jgi:6-phosphofructokinase 2
MQSAMELVVSLNPAVDVEWRVETVRWEEKNQVLEERRWPGGKGINVARWLKYLGGTPRLLIPLGGLNGREIMTGLREMGVRFSRVSLRENTRANVVVTTAAGKQLRFNPLGPTLSAAAWQNVLDLTRSWISQAELLILSGALPRGVPVAAYSRLINMANKTGVRSILDCDGAALRAGIKQRPFLVKPNRFEIEQWAGKSLKSTAALVGAAQALSRETAGWVLVSLGEAGGLLVSKAFGHQWICRPPKVKVRNTIGAGDALVAAAAMQLRKNAEPRDWLRWGVAAGTAAAECAAGELANGKRIKELYQQIEIKRV